MKNIVISLWIATILIIGIVFIQNQALFLSEQRLSFNLILHTFTFPSIHNGAIILLFFVIGALLSASSSLISRFKWRKALKNCKAAGEGYIDKIGELKIHNDKMKSSCGTKDTVLKSPVMATESRGERVPA